MNASPGSYGIEVLNVPHDLPEGTVGAVLSSSTADPSLSAQERYLQLLPCPGGKYDSPVLLPNLPPLVNWG